MMVYFILFNGALALFRGGGEEEGCQWRSMAVDLVMKRQRDFVGSSKGRDTRNVGSGTEREEEEQCVESVECGLWSWDFGVNQTSNDLFESALCTTLCTFSSCIQSRNIQSPLPFSQGVKNLKLKSCSPFQCSSAGRWSHLVSLFSVSEFGNKFRCGATLFFSFFKSCSILYIF